MATQSDTKTKKSTKKVTTSKKEVIESYQTHQKDTGSPKVQVAILTNRINRLTQHLQSNNGDDHSRRGLIQMVGKRRRLLRYIKSKNPDLYQELTDALGIRK